MHESRQASALAPSHCPPSDMAAMRLAISSSDTSSMCVESVHLCPNGSTRLPLLMIGPGEAAEYEVRIETDPGSTTTYSLSAPSPHGTLIVDLAPTSITPDQTATLTVTDTHPGPSLNPGLWHTIVVEATGDGRELSTEVRLLVGGGRVLLPQILN